MSASSRLKARFSSSRRRLLLPLGLGIAVLALLGYWLFTVIAPALPCTPTAVPSGSSGDECLNGVSYSYVTYSVPTAGQSAIHDFHGVTFLLTNYAGGSLLINGTEPGGFQFDLNPSSGTVVGGWTTAISPDRSFGAQILASSGSAVRLLVDRYDFGGQPQSPSG